MATHSDVNPLSVVNTVAAQASAPGRLLSAGLTARKVLLDCNGGVGAPRCSEGYVGLSRRRRRRASLLGRLYWIVTAQASARLAARKVMLDCHGAGDGAPRRSEGYVGLSRRRRRRSSLLGRLCWIVTAQVTARLAARMVMLDYHGAGLGAPRRSEGYVGLSRRRGRRASPLGWLCWIITVQASALLAARKVILDCHGADDGAPRRSEGYVGLSRCRHRRSSRLGRLCWIVTAQSSACLAARKVMLDCHGAGLGAPRGSEGYVGLSRRTPQRASPLRKVCLGSRGHWENGYDILFGYYACLHESSVSTHVSCVSMSCVSTRCVSTSVYIKRADLSRTISYNLLFISWMRN
jgi:hypothetical protein